jgi:membrane carboxypeptidase/penicillin-binding protein
MSLASEGRQVAGKTGTSNSRIAVWFLGYTTNLASAAVVTDAEAPQTSLMGQRIAGRVVSGDQVWGGTLAGPMWLAAMRGALEGRKSPNFVNPNPRMLEGIPTTVPSVVGMDQDQARSVLRKANFAMAVGGETHSDLPRGTIVRQTPGANTKAGSGSTVIVYLSDGVKPKPKPKPTPKPIPTTPGPFPKPTLPPPPDDDDPPRPG